MIVLREGNIFDYDHQALAHGVNSRGRMDRGIAVEFKNRFPEMYKEYAERCRRDLLKPGDIFVYRCHDLFIFNLVTQKNLKRAEEPFLEKAIQKMYLEAKYQGIVDIAMPEIGCGLGGLTVDILKEKLGLYFGVSDICVTVYHRA